MIRKILVIESFILLRNILKNRLAKIVGRSYYKENRLHTI